MCTSLIPPNGTADDAEGEDHLYYCIVVQKGSHTCISVPGFCVLSSLVLSFCFIASLRFALLCCVLRQYPTTLENHNKRHSHSNYTKNNMDDSGSNKQWVSPWSVFYLQALQRNTDPIHHHLSYYYLDEHSLRFNMAG